jgi:creatinine amidohydrolase
VSSLRAARLTWPDLRDRVTAGTPLILTVGSFEQHGPHLPLATDTLIAEAIVDRVAPRIGALALPVLAYGAPSRPRSGGGDLFPAPAIRLPALMAALASIAGDALDLGARRLVVLAWHLENDAVLWDALQPVFREAQGAKALLFGAPWDFLTPANVEELFGGEEPDWASDHAGFLETAIMLHLDPGMVGEVPAAEAFRPRRGYDVLPTPADAVPSTGVVLEPRAVTAAMGERCLDAMVDGIVAAVEAEG